MPLEYRLSLGDLEYSGFPWSQLIWPALGDTQPVIWKQPWIKISIIHFIFSHHVLWLRFQPLNKAISHASNCQRSAKYSIRLQCVFPLFFLSSFGEFRAKNDQNPVWIANKPDPVGIIVVSTIIYRQHLCACKKSPTNQSNQQSSWPPVWPIPSPKQI